VKSVMGRGGVLVCVCARVRGFAGKRLLGGILPEQDFVAFSMVWGVRSSSLHLS
jgi:hypothetical protein